ncbi:MAG TPA: L-dopachrome tautomerase-related protein [Candidatus Methylacidiphilales bacterium]|nr:L-dopachrome tautomerase-related protein [Candidatus Methylacidiphilales bacterium]
MKVKNQFLITTALATGIACSFPPLGARAQNPAVPEQAPVISGQTPDAPSPLQVVASFNEQPTGVAVSKTGRIFVNFPYWSNQHTDSVVELVGGHSEPFPDTIWNDPTSALTDPAHRFVCVQSVYADPANNLWVLDAAAPKFGPVVPGGAKLVKINLGSNTVKRIYYFDGIVAPPGSYLNDVRVDPVRNFAYISDSGLGAILVLDLASGKVRRVLDGAPETMATPGHVMNIDGQELLQADGTPFTINCDGIALDSPGDTLFFEAPSNGNLYSMPTAALRNDSLNPAALRARIRFVALIGPSDGFAWGPDGGLYITSVLNHSVKRLDPTSSLPFTVPVDDPRLSWPDSMAWSADGWLYITASQIPRMPRFNGGQDLAQLPYHLFRSQAITRAQPIAQ